jgi:hypothetical protein
MMWVQGRRIGSSSLVSERRAKGREESRARVSCSGYDVVWWGWWKGSWQISQVVLSAERAVMSRISTVERKATRVGFIATESVVGDIV